MSIRRKLLDIVHDKIRFKHHSISAEKTYIFWIKHYIFFHNKKDLDDDYGCVYLPYALERKYPNAKYETKWQFLFPMRNVAKDPRSEVIRRHHLHPQTPGRNIKQAAVKLKVHKRVASYIFRYSYTTHLLQNGIDLRSIQELLGRKFVDITVICIHVVAEMNKRKIASPLEI